MRRLGVNKRFVKYFYPGGYERKFDDAMFAAIRPGDVIWDVGANIGYYTVKFAVATGSDGFVYGFEPMPETFRMLSDATTDYKNIDLLCCALGQRDSDASMSNESEPGSPTNKIISSDSQSQGVDTIAVKVRSGDSLIGGEELRVPNFIKIDVEGYESDAIGGMSQLLNESELRTLAIEVHFALSEERGLRNAPMDIVSELRRNNFKVRWTDPSHIIATRE